MRKLFFITLLSAFFFQGIAQDSKIAKFSGDRSNEIKNILYWDSDIGNSVSGELSNGKAVIIQPEGEFLMSVHILKGIDTLEFAYASAGAELVQYLKEQGTVFSMAEIHEYDFDGDGNKEIIIIDSYFGNSAFRVYRFENEKLVEVSGINAGTLEVEFYEDFIFIIREKLKYKYNKDRFERIRD
jgi:hypothetical protein